MTQIPTEHQEQVQLFRWAALRPDLELLHAIPNGGERNVIVARTLKAEGVKAGVPDICLPVPRGGKCGLYIELKRQKGGRVSPEQLYWLEALMREGYACAVCLGWEAARQVIEDYMEGDYHGQADFSARKPRKRDAKAGAGAGR